MKRTLCLAVGLCLFLWSCDEGTPIAPDGAVVTLSASPSTISLGGESIVTILVQRSNGQPVNPGTTVFLSTDLGSVPATVETDATGRAQATLSAGDRTGTATVTALSGTATGETTVEIVTDVLSALELTVDPTSIPSTGGSVSLRALARDEDGLPLSGVAVTFSTEVGTLDSNGGVVFTNSNGVARDRLRVSAATAEARAGTSFQVGATAIQDGTSETGEAEIEIEEPDGT